MPNTSKGFPYPTSSDDPNVPQDIQLLAQAVDTSLNNYSQTTHTHTGVYATTTHTHDGVYANTTHTHTEYLEPSDLAGYSQNTHTHDTLYSGLSHVHTDYLNTSAISGVKGAIPIGTAGGVSIITPGTNDYVLVSDSTTATGTKWANVAAVGTVVPNTFSNIAVSGQTTVSADSTVDTLNLTAGSNVTITTDPLTDTITISATGGDLSGHLAAADPHPQYLTQSEADILYDADGSAAAAQSAANIYTDTAISNLVNAAPSTLNTLKELSDALGGDALFATTVTNALASKAPINSPSFTGTVNFSGATITGYNPFPTQTGNGGKYLTTNGTSTSWGTIDLTPYLTISSAASTYLNTTTASNVYAPKASPSFTGTVDFTGATSVVGLSSILPSQSGNSGKFLGTNGSTAQWASISQVPDQTDNSGKYLTTDGTTASWATVSSTPAEGSITSAMILNETIVDSDISLSAAIDKSKISGIAVTQSDVGTVTNVMLAGTITNNKLANSSITINGNSVALGASTTIDALPSQLNNSGKYLTTNGSSASWATLTTNNYSNGTNTSTANKIFYNNTGSFPTATAAGDIYIQY